MWVDLMLLVELVGRLEGVEDAMDVYVSTLHMVGIRNLGLDEEDVTMVVSCN